RGEPPARTSGVEPHSDQPERPRPHDRLKLRVGAQRDVEQADVVAHGRLHQRTVFDTHVGRLVRERPPTPAENYGPASRPVGPSHRLPTDRFLRRSIESARTADSPANSTSSFFT